MRSLIDRTLWWQERQRMLLLKTATLLAILAGDGYQSLRLIPPTQGSFSSEPAGFVHFDATPDGGAILQVTGKGPTKAGHVDPSLAPKKN